MAFEPLWVSYELRLSPRGTEHGTCGDNHKVATAEADEAVRDIDAVWFDPDPANRSNRSVRVIGYSHSRRAILTVILVHRGDGAYYGAHGWESNPADHRRYREAQ